MSTEETYYFWVNVDWKYIDNWFPNQKCRINCRQPPLPWKTSRKETFKLKNSDSLYTQSVIVKEVSSFMSSTTAVQQGSVQQAAEEARQWHGKEDQQCDCWQQTSLITPCGPREYWQNGGLCFVWLFSQPGIANQKKEEISSPGACPPPPLPLENVESRDWNLCNLRHSGGKFEEMQHTKIYDEYQFCAFSLHSQIRHLNFHR